MIEFTKIVLVISILFSTFFFVWLIIQCKSLLTGFTTACSAIAVCYAICKYAYYIALAIVWGVRFAMVFVIIAFVLGIFPRNSSSSTYSIDKVS